MKGRLSGRVAIVTGGGNGIGRAVAETLAREGARVAVADVDAPAARRAADAIRRRGGAALDLQADVTREADVAAMVRETVRRFGGLDILVNNAGAYPRFDWRTLTAAGWRRQLDVNLTSQFLCAQAAAPFLKRRRRGAIVNFASVTVFLGHPRNLVHYTAAKAGVIGLTRALARELGGDGVRVNALSIGAVESPAERRVTTPAKLAAIVSQQCLQTRVQPEDVAAAAVFLASDDARAITGQTLNVDGGWVLH